jgi:hypothetical protein
MSKVDQIISEQCSKDFLEAYKNGRKPDDTLMQNLFVSTVHMLRDGDTPGPNYECLHRYLEAEYSYTDISEKPGFSIGAVFGSLKFLEEFRKAEKG